MSCANAQLDERLVISWNADGGNLTGVSLRAELNDPPTTKLDDSPTAELLNAPQSDT